MQREFTVSKSWQQTEWSHCIGYAFEATVEKDFVLGQTCRCCKMHQLLPHHQIDSSIFMSSYCLMQGCQPRLNGDQLVMCTTPSPISWMCYDTVATPVTSATIGFGNTGFGTITNRSCVAASGFVKQVLAGLQEMLNDMLRGGCSGRRSSQ